MHDGVHVRPSAIDFTVNEPLEVYASAVGVEGSAIEVERDDVVAPHQCRRHVARQQEVHGRLVMAHADVTETIDDTLVVQDAVGDDELVDQRTIGCGNVWHAAIICEWPTGRQRQHATRSSCA